MLWDMSIVIETVCRYAKGLLTYERRNKKINKPFAISHIICYM